MISFIKTAEVLFMYEKELEKILKEAGADLVGFSSLGENRPPEHPE